MSPCPKCHDNNWDYKKLDNDPHIYCRCKNCSYEFNFLIPKKKCGGCGQPADFERLYNEKEKWRGKKCLLCGYTKKIPIAEGKFMQIDGESKMLMEDGEWHTMEFMEGEDKQGTFIQLVPID